MICYGTMWVMTGRAVELGPVINPGPGWGWTVLVSPAAVPASQETA
jgi:hypothetical protein